MSADRVRRNFGFPRVVDNSLQAIAKRHGISLTEAVRDAVILKEWFDKAREDGRRILVEDENGIREIVPR